MDRDEESKRVYQFSHSVFLCWVFNGLEREELVALGRSMRSEEGGGDKNKGGTNDENNDYFELSSAGWMLLPDPMRERQ